MTESSKEAEAGAELREEEEEEARSELRALVEDLEGIRARLVALHGRLPLPADEAALLDDEVELDFATEVRSVIAFILEDRLQPTIGDLAEAAAYQPKKRK